MSPNPRTPRETGPLNLRADMDPGRWRAFGSATTGISDRR